MGDRQAGLDLKATDDATDEWIMLPRHAASFSLISRRNRQGRRSLSALSKKRLGVSSDMNATRIITPPGDHHFTAKNYCCINDLLNKLLYSSGLAGRTLFMTNGDARKSNDSDQGSGDRA
jgi:hypothetical protein